MSGKMGIAVITGASSGLGAVYADRLAKQGYDLQLVARRKDRLDELAKRLHQLYGIHVEAIACDLGASNELEKLAKSLESNPHITALINNAGTVTLAPVAETSLEKALAQTEVNMTALMRLTYAVLPGFKARNQGTLVNIASVLALNTLPVSSIYSGTKAFVLHFTRGLQTEFSKTNIRIQAVLPASTATEIWDLGGIPLSSLRPEIVMTAEDCVDASLAGLAKGELVTLPSLEDTKLWDQFEKARMELFMATQTGKPASRYTNTKD